MTRNFRFGFGALALLTMGGCTANVAGGDSSGGTGATSGSGGGSSPTGSGGSSTAGSGGSSTAGSGGSSTTGSGGSSTAGSGGSSTAGSGGSSTTGSGGSAPPPCQGTASLAPTRIWRITDQQYVNVVAQVFGVRVSPEVTQADTQPAEFTNFSEAPELTVQANVASAYQLAAHNAAQAAVAVNLAAFLPCGQTAPTDACVQSFIRNRVARAFGRALTTIETQDLLALYHVGLQDNAATGIRLIIEATLQAPSFLYRTELGSAAPANGKVTLTANEIAGAVAFALLDSVPDDQLWQKAQDGTLLQPAVLTAEIDRLLASPNVQANLGSKAGFWLGVEKLHSIVPKNTTIFPQFTPALKQALYDSATMFVRDVFTHGTLNDLLSSRRMYVNSTLASVYGISGVTGTNLVPMDLSLPERSAGILTQPAVLAAWSHPDRGDVVHRGLFIYNALVCGSQIPAAPPNALTIAATFPADATERQLAGLRATNAAGCGGCHALFDPLGLATERYDAIGRYTPNDAAGNPIDASSTIVRLGADLDGPVADLPALVAKLKVGRRVADCASRNLAVFVLGRSVTVDNSCALKDVKDRFATSGSFMDFYRAILTSPGFLTRDVAQ